MAFELKDVLQTAGPTASLVFASWIFLQLLTQKFQATVSRYRTMIAEYRDGEGHDDRRRHLAEQIPLYKRRCEQMQRATVLGVVAAMLLIFTLLLGTIDTITTSYFGFVKYFGAASAVSGLALLLYAAYYLILENKSVVAALESDLKDLPDLARSSGLQALEPKQRNTRA